MKTAKEILRIFLTPPRTRVNEIEEEVIIKAMEIFANQSKWIDIKTAKPKKGAFILAYGIEEGEIKGKSKDMQVGVIEWMDGFGYLSADSTSMYMINITHWMPLPEEPKLKFKQL